MNKVLVIGGLCLTVLASIAFLLFVFGALQPMDSKSKIIYNDLIFPVLFCVVAMYLFGSSFVKQGTDELQSNRTEKHDS